MPDSPDLSRPSMANGDAVQPDTLRRSFLHNLLHVQGKIPALATPSDFYLALAHTVRNGLLRRWISTAETYRRERSRTVAYLSAEFLSSESRYGSIENTMYYRLIGCMDRVLLS